MGLMSTHSLPQVKIHKKVLVCLQYIAVFVQGRRSSFQGQVFLSQEITRAQLSINKNLGSLFLILGLANLDKHIHTWHSIMFYTLCTGNTALTYACAGGFIDVVKVLLKEGANIEDHNENGHTPLMEAASAGHVEVARVLLEYGAGINTHSNEFKESALTLACYKGQSPSSLVYN